MTALNGKYVLERRLGGGGMAEVFLARTVGVEGFSRQVAIKRVLPGVSDDPMFASMFISEARVTSRLQHANVVSVLDFDRDADGRLFLVMELVNGTDLDGLLTTGPLDFGLMAYIAVEILRGLDHAHDLPTGDDGVRGLVHRDISPHNVLLSWDGEVKVSDFGIAKARSATSATASIMVKGKPAWMSPEQARGDKLDGRSDLFAVGVMLFEMITLQRLFLADTTEATLAKVWFAPIPPVRQVRPDAPEDLARIVDWMLQRDLAARAPNAATIIAEFEACSVYPRNGRRELTQCLMARFPGRAPVRASSIARSSPAAPTIAAYPRQTRTATPSSSPPRRGRAWRWLVAAVVGFGAAGAGAALVARDRSATVPSSPVGVRDAGGASGPAIVAPGPSLGEQAPHDAQLAPPIAPDAAGAAAAQQPNQPAGPVRELQPKTRAHPAAPARAAEPGIREVPLGTNAQ